MKPMTTDERLTRLRELVAQYDAASPWFEMPFDAYQMLDDVVGHFRALDEEMSNGEILPEAWKSQLSLAEVDRRVVERSDLVDRFLESGDTAAMIELMEYATGAKVESVRDV